MSPSQTSVLLLESCTVDLRARRVVRGTEEIALTTREAEFLSYICARPDMDVTHEELHLAFGYHASANTRAALHVVGRLRKKIERDPANPRHLLSVHGVGYRWTCEVAHRSGNQAPEPHPILGREALVEEVERQLATHVFVTLKGFGGVGKSRLASEVALRWAGEVWRVEVGEAGTQDLLQAIARTLGLVLAEEDPVEQLGRALAIRDSLLIVLDDAWLSARALECLARLRERAPRVRWLTTVRVALRLRGEVVVEVAPLEEADAVLLLRERCAAHGWPLHDDAGTIALVTRVDRLPLGIVLAAARLAVMSPGELAARLDRERDLLVAREADSRPEHASLRLVFERSWEVLDPPSQQALAELTVFGEPFDLPAAEAVVAGLGVVERLEHLLEASLVARRNARGGVQFALPAVVRDFAAERLSPEAFLGALRRHAAWFAELPVSGGAMASRAAACRSAIRLRDTALAVAAAERFGALCSGSGLAAAAASLADELEVALPLTPDEQAQIARVRAKSYAIGGRLLDAVAELERIALHPLSSRVAADVLVQLGFSRLDQGDFSRAGAEAVRATGYDPGNPDITRLRAAIAMRAGEPEAIELASHALACYRERNETHWIASTLQIRGGAYINARRVAEARVDLDAAKQTFTAEGDLHHVLLTSTSLASIAIVEGDMPRAIVAFRELVAESERLGLVRREAHLRMCLGGVLMEGGELDQAKVELGRAVRMARQVGDVVSESVALVNLGHVEIECREWEKARAFLRSAEARLSSRALSGCDVRLLAILRDRIDAQEADFSDRAARAP